MPQTSPMKWKTIFAMSTLSMIMCLTIISEKTKSTTTEKITQKTNQKKWEW